MIQSTIPQTYKKKLFRDIKTNQKIPHLRKAIDLFMKAILKHIICLCDRFI